MKFNTGNKIIDVICDCGCSNLKVLSIEDEKRIKGFNSVRFVQKFSCVECGTLFNLPFSWEVNNGN